MIPSSSRFRALVALALLPVVLAACANGGSNGTAASVGGVDISIDQLREDVVAFRFLSQLSNSPCGTPAQGESQDAACARVALSNDIQEEVVKAYAAEHDVAVDPADVRGAIAQLEQSLGSADALDGQLKDAGLTRDDLRTLARRLLLFNAVRHAIADERLDDTELRAAYEQAKPQFTTVEVSHILLATRRDAQEVADHATPDNFAKLAKQRSTDTGSAKDGGSLGSYSEAQFRQQFDPTFVEAALALQPGEISGVVHTQFGYHVIELVRRDVATFEQVRDQLVAQQSAQVFTDWLKGRYRDLDIDVNPRYGRLDRSTGLVEAIRSTERSPAASGASGASGSSGATGSAVPSP